MQISQLRDTGHHASRAQQIEHVRPYKIPSHKKPSRLNRTGVALPAAICGCKNRKRISTSFCYTYWNFKFTFEQQGFQEHDRRCKLYKIDTPTKSKMKAQIPLKLAWFSRRITLACIELVLGTSSPGISMAFKNFVPKQRDPVRLEIEKLSHWLKRGRRFKRNQLKKVQSIERTILSLYRDGKSSPTHRCERGESHAKVSVS